MKIFINNQSKEFIPGITLAEVVAPLLVSLKGSAVAVNNKVVAKSEWATEILKENDRIIIISAVCGG